MEERHLHFNLISAMWLLVFIVVISNAAKYATKRWWVPGLSDLVQNT